MVEIFAIGGYNEVGKNMTAIKVGNEIVILDMGIHLDSYIKYTQDEDIENLKESDLRKAGAVPDDTQIHNLRNEVIAIIPTHAHLDHVGAIPFCSNKYNAPIICTPFTAAVIKAIVRDEKINLRNEIKSLNINSKIKLSDDITVEFINVTHSTPQTIIAALHTKEGVILYANDFKFDLYPTLGQKPNFERLEELGKEGVFALIVDSTYASLAQKMPSESVAQQMLKDVLLGTNSKGKAVIITTFSSHIARLKSIVEFGRKMGRKIVFLGRSLAKYSYAAEDVGIAYFSKDTEIVKFGSKVKGKLSEIMKKGKEKYLLVVTGHQGELKSTLSKMADLKTPFIFDSEDHVIFSSRVIPTPTNIEDRAILEKKLRGFGCRIFTDIHVSGHAAREDLRDMINLVKPKHIIPAHGEPSMLSSLMDLAIEMGYKKENVHLMRDGRKLSL
ncbi:MAG: RNase J family beta-CASP ribonuclease [Candidatus Woesearchaeota archaeon]|nr:RNase J family beta-CASP ribonuclease [Candidatus Woesearchaeota archaeon]